MGAPHVAGGGCVERSQRQVRRIRDGPRGGAGGWSLEARGGGQAVGAQGPVGEGAARGGGKGGGVPAHDGQGEGAARADGPRHQGDDGLMAAG
eukprot:5894440-Prymnesium_polylepis.1